MRIGKWALLAIASFFLLVPGRAYPAPDIRFGTLPVIQCLPVFVAAEKGFFKEQGISVELVAFNSALEKDVAFTSGQIAGYFGDIQTCMVLNANRIPIKIVAVVYNSTSQRMFAFILAPKYSGKELNDVVGGGVAVSSNTILDFLTAKFLSLRNISPSQVKMVEIKNIPVRLQMLTAGQVSVAVLPEPLATLAEMKGGKSIMDDAGRGLSATVLAFHDGFTNKNPEKIKAFVRAVARASEYINKNPEEARSIMNRECRIPDQLKLSFPIPRFPGPSILPREQVREVSQWLHKKGSIKKEVLYNQLVADGYLP
ncbi:MAG TPA: ABC transporter substrate-binding protein [Syntrophorhabdaceae bacterium]